MLPVGSVGKPQHTQVLLVWGINRHLPFPIGSAPAVTEGVVYLQRLGHVGIDTEPWGEYLPILGKPWQLTIRVVPDFVELVVIKEKMYRFRSLRRRFPTVFGITEGYQLNVLQHNVLSINEGHIILTHHELLVAQEEIVVSVVMAFHAVIIPQTVFLRAVPRF
jgi:hypothetical protein